MAKIAVAPLVGAWIEMYLNGNEDQPELVAPLVGAWIEIFCYGWNFCRSVSLPSWERGLKFSGARSGSVLYVAPLVGAWIEMTLF